MKLTRLITGSLLLMLPVAVALAQNSNVTEHTWNTTSHNVQQQKQVQTSKTVSIAKPAAHAAPAKRGVVHLRSTSAKMSGKMKAATKTAHPSLKVASYPAAKPKASAPKPAGRSRKVVKNAQTVNNVKNVKKEAPRKVKAAIEVTKTKTAAPEKAADKQADKQEDKVVLTGRRDPFVSPVMLQSATGPGCSTGKRCLAIDQINLKGIVRSENGMIAVVVNALDKAYFLHENDPVFNGYVVKITGDSIIFKETIQDKLGKALTREVTKRISTPAV